MLKAGTETGSMMNHLMSGAGESRLPAKVGDAATILGWTDRYAGTVIKVTATQVHVQQDIAKRTDSNGMSESQTYEYSRDPNGKIYVFRKTNRGYRSEGRGLLIGDRAQYHDFSF